MLAAQPFRWTNPATWPWIIYVWLALLACAGFPTLWRWFQRRRAATWPAADGCIEQTTTHAGCAAELLYSYSVERTTYGGFYRREFSTEAGAKNFVRDLEGRTVAVRYSLGRPSQSIVLDCDIEAALLNRPLANDEESAAATGAPNWMRPLVWVLAGLSAIGLVLSVWVHAGSLVERPATSPLSWVLNAGIFIVGIPSTLIGQRIAGWRNRRDYWKVVMKGSPDWMRYMVYAFLAYAILNFTIILPQVSPQGSGAKPPALAWKGFSGYWMALYSASLAILYSAANTRDSSSR